MQSFMIIYQQKEKHKNAEIKDFTSISLIALAKTEFQKIIINKKLKNYNQGMQI